MPDWGEVSKELRETPIDIKAYELRRKYLSILHQYTMRNIITYYSAFLQKPKSSATSIDDNDKNAFMQAVYGLDRKKGLDLILHTPGGNIAATESIVVYLKEMFGRDIRVIVPQIAMSAGTMIALSSKEIIMGKHSNLGPIDPQFGGVSCHGIIEEFNRALKDIKIKPESASMWGLIIKQYHPTFLGDCENAITWSKTMVQQWLSENMFYRKRNKQKIVEDIVKYLSSHNKTFSHQKHLHIAELKRLGLNITALESYSKDPREDCKDLQDCVLTLHHAYMQTMSASNVMKIVENHQGVTMEFTSAVKCVKDRRC